MSQPRIVLVDDHTLFRKGLAELLERDGDIKVVAMTGAPSGLPPCWRSIGRMS
jgi:two-component system nitrate/nitrite response regulator NarL